MEAAALEKGGDDSRQMDVPRRFGHQGLDQGFGKAPAPVGGIDAQGAELQAIGMGLESDQADDPSVVFGHPEGVALHPRVVQSELLGQTGGGSGFPGAGSADLHVDVL